MRRAARRDPAERAIMDALRGARAFVTQLDGDGVPDLLVGYAGRWQLFEVKAPQGPRGGQSAKGQHLRPSQVMFFAEATMAGCPVHIVSTPERALELIGKRVEAR